ncbi:ectoine hydroxylase [Sphingosinicella rhizophila]|uniref:Ectoine hydroxylase n=1 Tax=Sphingosinicella rhizophila TaxID=3050082 RepID=A0ABU3Q6P8_9SPHN|nr:ectoine hydroxylase [Sphingosinicella sp. GR2756]MDT9599093.1 ectoine hydroxylase [Sphingosinicella sp. GR2756]
MTDLYSSRCEAQPHLLPRHDPVVYGEWTPDAPLTRAQMEQFDSQGFLILPGVFDKDEVASLQAEVGNLLADPAALDDRTTITEPGSDEIRSIFEIHRQNDLMARLAADERLAGVARLLLDDDVYVHQSRLNYKPGYQGKEFFWHSDFETWHVEDGMPRMRALSASVLLAANTDHNGPLMLMPGSHRNFLACVGETPDDHYLVSLKKQEYGVPDETSLAELAEAHGIVAAVGEPGTVVLFDCNMMHGSNGNITPYPRANAFIVYNALSNRLTTPYGAKAPRPSFIAARDAEPVRIRKGRLA